MNEFLSLLTQAESIFWVIIFFGGSIFIHELGHFLAARYYGLKVDRFSIGFGPKIVTWKGKDTEYCISLFPLGGYVALPELADLSAIEGPYEKTRISTKPISYKSRVVVLAMGAFFNVLFAIGLSLILYYVGQPIAADENTTTIGYIPPILKNDDKDVTAPALTAGLLPGDKIISIDDQNVTIFSDIEQLIAVGTGIDEHNQPQAKIAFERQGTRHTVTASPILLTLNPETGEKLRILGLIPASTVKVGSLIPHSPAEKSGLLPGDVITHFNNQPLYALITLSEYLKNNPYESVNLTLERNHQTIHLTLTPERIPFTQPSLKLTLKDDPQANLLFIPKAHQTTHTLIEPQSTLEHFILLKKEEGATGNYFEALTIGDRWIGFSNSEGIETMDNTLSIFNYSTVPQLAMILKNEKTGLYFWTIPQEAKLEMIPPQTTVMLGLIQDTTPKIVHLSPWTQIKKSIQTTFNVLKSLINPHSDIHLNNLMGPPGIMRILHTFSSIDLRLVIAFSVLLNINLAILNLLPLPILDGGQILFATINRFKKRPLSPRLIRGLQECFILLLFGTMIYISFFDIRRWRSDHIQAKQQTLYQSFYIEPHFNP